MHRQAQRLVFRRIASGDTIALQKWFWGSVCHGFGLWRCVCHLARTLARIGINSWSQTYRTTTRPHRPNH